MAKFLDLSVNGIALGAVSGGTNTTQALLSTTASNVLQLSGTNTSTLCRLSGVDQPQADTDATNRLYLQTYVLGQIHGLQMKPAVKLCSTTAVSLTSNVTTYRYTGPFAQGAEAPSKYHYIYPQGRPDSWAEDATQVINPTFFQSNGKLSVGFKWQYNSIVSSNPFGLYLGLGGLETHVFFCPNPGGNAIFNIEVERSGDPIAPYSLPPSTDIYFWWQWDLNAQVSTWDIAMLQGGVLVPVEPTTGAVTHPHTYTTAPGISGALPTGQPSTWAMSSLYMQSWGPPQQWSGLRVENTTYTTIQNCFFGPPPPPGWASSGIDGGHIPVANDRVLLTGQVTASQNGIWQVNSAGNALVRPADYAAGGNAGANFVFVDGIGTHNNDQGYLCTSLPGQDIIDTNTTSWIQYTSTGGNVGSLQFGTDSITTASGTLSFVNNNLTTSGTVASTAQTCGTLSIQAGNIYDSSGAINFNSDNLRTTGQIHPASISRGFRGSAGKQQT